MTELLPEATKKHVCPECGEEFALAMRLGLHRRREHGVAGTTPKRKSSGTTKAREASSPKTRRKQAVASTLKELADLADDARGRSTEMPEHLADVIRRDADKIATTVSTVAEKVNPVAWFVDVTMGPTGILTLIVGLSGVGRWLLRSWRQSVDNREQPQEVYPVDQLTEPVDDFGIR